MIERLKCSLARHAMARWAVLGDPPPAGSWLATHLDSCAPCRAASAEFRQLAAGLSRHLTAPGPSDAFTASVRHRAAGRVPRPFPGIAALVVAAAAAAALAAAWHFRSPAVPPEKIVRRPTVAPSVEPIDQERGLIHQDTAIGLPEVSPLPSVNPGPPRIRPRREKLARWVPPRAATRSTSVRWHRPRLAQRPPAPPSVETWTAYGALSDSFGQPRLAATAYGRAFAASGDPGLGLAAGQASENAGDMGDAVGYYARLLASSR